MNRTIAIALALSAVFVSIAALVYVLQSGSGGSDVKLSDHRNFLGKDDGISVLVCGSGSELSDPSRAMSCVIVVVGEKDKRRTFVVDAGSSSARNLNMWGFPVEDVEAVLLTGVGAGSLGDLLELHHQAWSSGRTKPLDVYGPGDIGPIVDGLSLALQGERESLKRRIPSLPKPAPMVGKMLPMPLEGATAPSVIVHDKDLTISAIALQNDGASPSVAYRFQYRDRSVVVAGATSKLDPLATLVKDAHLFISPAQSNDMLWDLHTRYYHARDKEKAAMYEALRKSHADLADIAKVASKAGVKELVLTRFVPTIAGDAREDAFERVADENMSGRVWLARDGMTFKLAANSSYVEAGTYGSGGALTSLAGSSGDRNIVEQYLARN